MSETDLNIQEAEEEVPAALEIEDDVHVESKYIACLKLFRLVPNHVLKN